MTTTKTPAKTTSDKILDTFDAIVGDTDTMPIEEIKHRFANSKHYNEYNDYEIYDTVITLPLTVDMITGDHRSDIAKVVDGLKGIYGDKLLIDISKNSPSLRARMWKDDTNLRRVFKTFAEREYNAQILTNQPS